jgi:hypothetical protein
MVRRAALKQDGTKCKSHSTEPSKYCASHKGWRPTGRAKKVLDGAAKAREMKTMRKRAASTKDGTAPIRNRPAAVRLMGAKNQCTAQAHAGRQCKGLPRESSK